MQENKVDLSIIVPVWNAERTIAHCIESVINQSVKPCELLIIDNNSTDDTLNIVKQFAASNTFIKCVSEPDAGIYDAMNKGLKLSTGNWIYFLGSDDVLYDNEVLSKVKQFIENSRNKILYGNVLINGDCGWAKDQQVYDGEFTMEKLLKNNICHQAVFYHKSVFKKTGGFNTKYRICADYDFNLKVASRFKMQYIDLVIARFNAGGLSTRQATDDFEEDFGDNVIQYFKRKLLKRYMRPFLFSMISLGKQKIRSGRYADGLYYLLSGYYHKLKSV